MLGVFIAEGRAPITSLANETDMFPRPLAVKPVRVSIVSSWCFASMSACDCICTQHHRHNIRDTRIMLKPQQCRPIPRYLGVFLLLQALLQLLQLTLSAQTFLQHRLSEFISLSTNDVSRLCGGCSLAARALRLDKHATNTRPIPPTLGTVSGTD